MVSKESDLSVGRHRLTNSRVECQQPTLKWLSKGKKGQSKYGKMLDLLCNSSVCLKCFAMKSWKQRGTLSCTAAEAPKAATGARGQEPVGWAEGLRLASGDLRREPCSLGDSSGTALLPSSENQAPPAREPSCRQHWESKGLE